MSAIARVRRVAGLVSDILYVLTLAVFFFLLRVLYEFFTALSDD